MSTRESTRRNRYFSILVFWKWLFVALTLSITSQASAGMPTAGGYVWADAAGKTWRIDQQGGAVATNLPWGASSLFEAIAYHGEFVGWLLGTGWISSTDGVLWKTYAPPALVPAISIHYILKAGSDIYAQTNSGMFHSRNLREWTKFAPGDGPEIFRVASCGDRLVIMVNTTRPTPEGKNRAVRIDYYQHNALVGSSDYHMNFRNGVPYCLGDTLAMIHIVHRDPASTTRKPGYDVVRFDLGRDAHVIAHFDKDDISSFFSPILGYLGGHAIFYWQRARINGASPTIAIALPRTSGAAAMPLTFPKTLRKGVYNDPTTGQLSVQCSGQVCVGTLFGADAILVSHDGLHWSFPK